jgi:ABC-type transport system involved in cytochrome bd biosynthesis fused ATPase/permease subunit
MRTAVAWIITAVWAAGYVRKLIDPNFPVPAEVTPVMLLAAGYLFGRDVKEKLRERVRRELDDQGDT